jgi:hypothetical protein
MKHLKLFENYQNIPGEMSINNFLMEIAETSKPLESIENWWNINRKDIKLNYFPFNTTKPIMGVFIGTDRVLINSRIQGAPWIFKLFLALHESKHCDQHREGRLTEHYYDTVVNNDFDKFIIGYKKLEEEANIFALNSMTEMGFDNFVNLQGRAVRRNEEMGQMVFRMMSDDIKKYQPKDFSDLMLKQIL